MSGHDIDLISEDVLSPLTHIAHLTHKDYNFIVLKHILLILAAFLDPSIPPGLFGFDTLKGRNLLFTSPSELMRISSIFIALLRGPSFGVVRNCKESLLVFLASPDALEVIVVPYSLTHSLTGR